MTTPSPLTLVAHQLRYDLRAFRRNRQALASTLALPVILLVVLVSANGGETTTYDGRTVTLAQYLVPGLVAFGLIAASFLSLVVEVVAQRESGVLKRRRGTPVTAAVLVAGRTLTAAVASIAVAWVLLAVAGNRYDVVVPRAGLPALAAAVLLGAVTFASLGYALASAIRTPAAAQPVASLVFLPFLLVSGVLVPADRLPDRLAAVARVFPVEHLANAIRYALDPAVTGNHLAVTDLAVLAAWAVGGFLIAHRRFRWLPRARSDRAHLGGRRCGATIAPMSLTALSHALAERRLSSRQATTATLEAIDAAADLGAFLTLDPEGALVAADEADRRLAAGERTPLLGVPVGVKDLQETAGLRTTYGALRFRDNVPDADCIAVARLRAAGAVIVGKTNTPAFGLLGETKNRLGPETRNPCDRSLTTGGSSGGSAAAVAAGLVTGATGTDSAGSITAPSSMCGTFGIKPTLGTIPTWPIPDDSMLFLTHGPIAATVADAVALLGVMAGHDGRDPVARRTPLPDLAAALAAAAGDTPLRGLQVAWSATLDWFAVDDEVRTLVAATAHAVAELGAELDEAAPTIEHPMELYFPIFGVDTRRGVVPLMEPDDFYPESAAEFARYPELTAEDHVGLLQRLWRLRSALDDFFAHYDVLITPATATPAFPLGVHPTSIGGIDVEPGWMTYMPFSAPWNLGTHPTASVPSGTTRDGRPVGTLVVAQPGREDLVVRVAAALELARPWPVPEAAVTT